MFGKIGILICNFCKKINEMGVLNKTGIFIHNVYPKMKRIYYNLKSFNNKLEFGFLMYAGKFRGLGCLENMSSDSQFLQINEKNRGVWKNWNLDFKFLQETGIELFFAVEIFKFEFTTNAWGWGCFELFEFGFTISA